MTLTRRKKIALAIATAWLPFYILLFMAFVVFTVLSFHSGSQNPESVPTTFIIIFPLHLLTVVVSLALMITYILHATKNEALDQSSRHLWAILIFIGSFVAMPIYFYKYILPFKDDPQR